MMAQDAHKLLINKQLAESISVDLRYDGTGL